MVAKPRRQRLILPVAPLGGAVMGLVTAVIFALVPGDMLGRVILRSGIPAIIAAAEPPLGMTARIVLALMGGGTIALLGWFALFLVLGTRTVMFGAEAVVEPDPDTGEGAPILRRADAHPDAPSRRPVFANRDLGTPFLEVRAREPLDEAAALPISRGPVDLPIDLDQPLSAFDPGAIGKSVPVMPATPAMPAFAIPPEPTDDVEPVLSMMAPPPLVTTPARRQIFEPTERFETFELTPMVRTEPSAPPEPRREPRAEPRDTQATINALLERLERGVTDRNARPPAPAAKRDIRVESRSADRAGDRLEDTLGTLRRMATHG